MQIRSVMSFPVAVLAVAGTTLLATSSVSAHEGDVGLSFISGRLTTGIVSAPGGPGTQEFVVPGQRVFGAEFGLIGTDVYAADPGFFSGPMLGGGPLPTIAANSLLGFNILGSAQRWDVPSQSFVSAIGGERIRIEFAAGALSRTSPNDSSTVSGFTFNVGPTGGFDEHYDYYLDAPAGAPIGSAPADGIYLLALELFLGGINGSTSLPYYLVFNYNLSEEQHDAAIEYTEVNIVPSPSAALALGMMAAPAFLRRRR